MNIEWVGFSNSKKLPVNQASPHRVEQRRTMLQSYSGTTCYSGVQLLINSGTSRPATLFPWHLRSKKESRAKARITVEFLTQIHECVSCVFCWSGCWCQTWGNSPPSCSWDITCKGTGGRRSPSDLWPPHSKQVFIASRWTLVPNVSRMGKPRHIGKGNTCWCVGACVCLLFVKMVVYLYA